MRWMVLDGIDATGKTTLCHALVKHYEEKGLRCLFAPEFSTSFVGKGILDIVDDRRFFRMDQQKQTLIADLMVLIADVFCKYELKAAPDADVVIMERGIISALGYQLIRLFRAMPEARDGDLADRLFEYISSASRYTHWPDCHFTLKISIPEMERRIAERNEIKLTLEQSEMFAEIQKRMLTIGPHFRAIEIVVDDKSIDELLVIVTTAFERRTFGRR